MKRRVVSVILYIYAWLKLLFFNMYLEGLWLEYIYYMRLDDANFKTMISVFSVGITAYTAFLCIGKERRNVWDYIASIPIFVWANFCLIKYIIVVLTTFAIHVWGEKYENLFIDGPNFWDSSNNICIYIKSHKLCKWNWQRMLCKLFYGYSLHYCICNCTGVCVGWRVYKKAK